MHVGMVVLAGPASHRFEIRIPVQVLVIPYDKYLMSHHTFLFQHVLRLIKWFRIHQTALLVVFILHAPLTCASSWNVALHAAWFDLSVLTVASFAGWR